MKTTLVALLVWAALLLGGQPRALADDQASATEEASQRFRRGALLFRDGAYRAALLEFERAYDLEPQYELLYNIAQARMSLHDSLGATSAFHDYLEQGGAAIEPARRVAVEAELKQLREAIGLISVTVDRAGAEVFVDDKLVGATPLTRSVAVMIGRHRVRVRAPDGKTAEESVDVSGGDVQRVALALDAAAAGGQESALPAGAPSAPNEADAFPYRKVALVSFIASAALGAGTIVALVLQRGEYKTFEEELDRVGGDPAKVDAARTSARKLAIYTDVLGGATLAALAAGVTFWLLDTGDAEQSQSGGQGLQLGLAGTRLVARGRF